MSVLPLKPWRDVHCGWSTHSREYEEVVSSAAAVLELVHRVRTECSPTVLQIWEASSGRSLSVGLGHRFSPLAYQENLDPPYYVSRGSGAAPLGLEFCSGMQLVDFELASLVPAAEVEPAIEWFLSHPGRPRNIDWVTV